MPKIQLTRPGREIKEKKYKQDFFHPKHPEKYIGDVNNIFFRSSWELRAMDFFDSNPFITRWSSEEIWIQYIHPFKKNKDGTPKVCRYFPDFWVEYKNPKGELIQEIIEVKPKSQTKRTRSRNPQRKLYEEMTLEVNKAKWAYAYAWCKKKNIKFKVVTEEDIFR